MRTTIAIDEDLMDELMRHEQGASRSEAIRRAVKDYLARKRADAFMKLAGNQLVDIDWREMERLELEQSAPRTRTRRERTR